jgi:hypothetical protein
MILFVNFLSCVVYNMNKWFFFKGEWKIEMFEGSLKTLIKLDRFVALTSIRDSSLNMI